jgi:hypothetical protein
MTYNKGGAWYMRKNVVWLRKIVAWLPAIGAGLVFGISMLVNYPNLPEFWGLPLAAWLIFILMIVQIVLLQHKITVLENPRPANWENVEFKSWSSNQGNLAKCAIEIINNKQENITDCYAELCHIYEKREGQYSLLIIGDEGELPCILPWGQGQEPIYDKIEIEIGKHRFLGMTYSEYVINISQYVIKGKNFRYTWPENGRNIYVRLIIAEMEISGKINDFQLKPKHLFVYIMRQHDYFEITEITTNPPIIEEEEEKEKRDVPF